MNMYVYVFLYMHINTCYSEMPMQWRLQDLDCCSHEHRAPEDTSTDGDQNMIESSHSQQMYIMQERLPEKNLEEYTVYDETQPESH